MKPPIRRAKPISQKPRKALPGRHGRQRPTKTEDLAEEMDEANEGIANPEERRRMIRSEPC